MSERFTITRRIELDAAHRVPDHRSKCFAIHGHRYVVEAVVSGPLFKEGEQRGMVMDFGFLKQVMMQEIHEPCDHGLILWRDDHHVLDWVLCHPLDTPDMARKARELNHAHRHSTPTWLKLYLISQVPTAENLAHHWYQRLVDGINLFFAATDNEPFTHSIRVEEVRVHETPNCVAVYKRPQKTHLNIGTMESPTNG